MKATYRICFMILLVFVIESLNAQVDTVKVEQDTVQGHHSGHKAGKKDEKSLTKSDKPEVLTDSILRKRHNPKIAIGLSAAFPGAGQIYNKKWWKLPIVYAGLGTTIYLIVDFAKKTKLYGREYNNRVNNGIENPDLAYYSTDNILSLKNHYRRNMEISIAACAIIYVLNIIDAAVDAHLFYFDVSDNLSMSVMPYVNTTSFGALNSGIGLSFRF